MAQIKKEEKQNLKTTRKDGDETNNIDVFLAEKKKEQKKIQIQRRMKKKMKSQSEVIWR